MNENEFSLDGVTYVAKDGMGLCGGCAFYDIDCVNLDRPSCIVNERTDRLNAIFVRKENISEHLAEYAGNTRQADYETKLKIVRKE